MTEALGKIYAVQEVDYALSDIRRKLNALDKGDMLKSETVQIQSAHDQAASELKRLTADLHDSELEQKSIEEKRKKFEQKLYSGSISNPKELDITEKEVEALKRQSSKLDDKIFELWDSIEAAKTEEAKTRTEREKFEKALSAHLSQYEEKKKALEVQFGQLSENRKIAVSHADPTLLAKYDVNRQKHGGVGIVKISEDLCVACGNKVPANNMNRLKEDSDIIITCENCSRILYLP